MLKKITHLIKIFKGDIFVKIFESAEKYEILWQKWNVHHFADYMAVKTLLDICLQSSIYSTFLWSVSINYAALFLQQKHFFFNNDIAILEDFMWLKLNSTTLWQKYMYYSCVLFTLFELLGVVFRPEWRMSSGTEAERAPEGRVSSYCSPASLPRYPTQP